jgi:hypothetical protein
MTEFLTARLYANASGPLFQEVQGALIVALVVCLFVAIELVRSR